MAVAAVPEVLNPSRLKAAAAVTRLKQLAPSAAVLAALSWWATYFVWGTGGREPHVLSTASVLLLAATLLVRPWRVLPLFALLLGYGLGAAAFIVVLTAPTGLAGADEAASYAYAGQLGLVVLAWARTVDRRVVVLGCLLAAEGLEFTKGWLPWWGSRDQTSLFQGTFYWHNQAGIFLVAGALLAFTVVAAQQRPLVALGWIVGPLCTAGVFFTTSRGSEIALGLGTLCLLGFVLLGRDVRNGWRRLSGVIVASAASTFLLAGPPFFSHWLSPFAGTEARANTLTGNGVQRLEDWRRAVAIFWHWPFSGAGFHSFDSATQVATTRHDPTRTAFAHNGFLQALADGGLVLAIPFFLAIGVMFFFGARRLRDALKAGDLLHVGGLVTFTVLLLHSGMDFDWSYPALLSLGALTPALLSSVPFRSVAGRRTAPVFVAVVLVLSVASTVGAWHGGLRLNRPVAGTHCNSPACTA